MSILFLRLFVLSMTLLSVTPSNAVAKARTTDRQTVRDALYVTEFSLSPYDQNGVIVLLR